MAATYVAKKDFGLRVSLYIYTVQYILYTTIAVRLTFRPGNEQALAMCVCLMDKRISLKRFLLLVFNLYNGP
uniref:Uncharacterized protein n=1 Tax=Daphnia magna TaxID=35525 RepID=A0A0P6HTZ8_9CRUS